MARPILTTAVMSALLFLLSGGHALAGENDCQRVDLEVTCTVAPSKVILVGDPFEVTATVRNTGELPLAEVTLALQGGQGISVLGEDELKLDCPKLEPGETRQLTAKFVSDQVGESRVSAHAREKVGWAAAGCYCYVVIKGLPALQLEMIDVDANKDPKGIFELGEEFIYVLEVENDVGTALTPELKIVWLLPSELEFVSGTGERGATVTNEGQTATSSPFILRPNQKLMFELLVRVVGVPKTNLIQTRAAVVTGSGGQELANETESTTLKQRAGAGS